MMLYLQVLSGTWMAINSGLSGHWWNGNDRSGEGLLVDASLNAAGDVILVVSFYTYDSMGNQVWLLATGPAVDGTTAEVDVYITEGRMWGDDFNPADGDSLEWGTATFTFPSCSAGSFTLTPNAAMIADGFTEIGYDIKRDLTQNGLQCPTFVHDAP